MDTKAMDSSRRLTTNEIEKLKNTSVSTGDVVTATCQVVADRLGINFSDIRKWFGESLDFMTKMGRWALAALYAEWVGTFRGIGAIVRGVFSGNGIGEILSDVGDAYKGAFDDANSAMIQFGEEVTKGSDMRRVGKG